MKLTKEIISVLKYHGFLTFTAPSEKILEDFNTFEDLCAAGLVSDRSAVTLVHSLFNDDGVNEVASAEPEVVEEPEPEVVEEPSEVVEEPVEAPVAEPESEVVEEPTTEEEASKPTPKKKTTTKKTTKKES